MAYDNKLVERLAALTSDIETDELNLLLEEIDDRLDSYEKRIEELVYSMERIRELTNA